MTTIRVSALKPSDLHQRTKSSSPRFSSIRDPSIKPLLKNDAHSSRFAICVHLVYDKDTEKTMSEKRVPRHCSCRSCPCYTYLNEVPRAGLAFVTSTEVPFACKCKQARGVFEPEKSLYIPLCIQSHKQFVTRNISSLQSSRRISRKLISNCPDWTKSNFGSQVTWSFRIKHFHIPSLSMRLHQTFWFDEHRVFYHTDPLHLGEYSF